MKKPSRYVRERMLLKNKPRKVLNLEERVQAIRMYDRSPVYQRVASAFKCSWEQIKNVVCNRNAILQYYARCQIIEKGDNIGLVRHKKINFLGNVMFEYIKRAYHYGRIVFSDDVVRDRALEFRDILKIEKFFPNRAWITDFKLVYNIDFKSLDKIVITQIPEKSLDCKDIIAFCTKELTNTLCNSDSAEILQEQASDERILEKSHAYTELESEFGENSYVDFIDCETDEEINENEEGQTINFGDYDYENDEEDFVQPSTSSAVTAMRLEQSFFEQANKQIQNQTALQDEIMTANMKSSSPRRPVPMIREKHTNDVSSDSIMSAIATTTTTKVKSCIPNLCNAANISPITTYAEALTLLGPLEAFAIYQEDFRAINLLNQLAEIYDKTIKRKSAHS